PQPPPTAAATSGPGSIARKTAGAERHDGFIPFYYDERTGKLLLEVARLDQDFLLLNSLATGLGSDRLGLDRGSIGEEAVVRFERHGPKLFLVRRNTNFRAVGGSPELVRSVDESFAASVLAALPILAEEDGRILVDATDFFVQDFYDVRRTIRQARQGDFRLDRDRSSIYLPRTKAFPKNTEVEVLLTFASDNPGNEIVRHTPDGRSLSLREHYSLVELPGPGFTPRAFDPRVGIWPLAFFDFNQPFDKDPVRRWAQRWRLVKKNPNAALSDPVQPIVYYLDPAIPEPYRTAFKEGAGWWTKVFEAAGFTNAFRVEDLPPGADPMDARYSVIQWVHRSDPGFSIGPSFVDPRTGEIIKAAVRLESHRSITDYNIWAGANPSVAGPLGQCDVADDGPGDWIAALDPDADATAFAMARRRQHAAHEVGHTLGLAHNFIAGSYGRASVMDYPGPLIRLENGHLDLSDAYRNGPGAYDSLAIRWAYTQFASPEEEARGLEAIVQDGIRRGIRFITDQDAGPDGSIPMATRWVNGSEILPELDRVTRVRDYLLDHFGPAAIATGEPMWRLGDRLGPVYLHHRYALEAALKAVGGMDFTYALRGDGETPTRILDPQEQRGALDRLLAALQPDALAIPERITALIPPVPYGYREEAYSFRSPSGVFDPIAAARTLASFIADGLLEPRRAARLVAQHARNPQAPSLEEVTSRLVEATWERPTPAV
ncbi:MAG: zinc-dependent metalloprotease, partial [Gemmatimonadetes bacterium]|nr:zinc-dependent metalloprotease [Gemmatimonadota bacterium]